jgi:hypothetical protein
MNAHARKRMDLAVVCCLALASASMLHGQVSILTWHNDVARTGQNLSEAILTPTNVQTSSFGLRFVLAVDGKVDAQPLYVPALTIASGTHNVLYVVTEHDSVYAFDSDGGTLLKQVSLIGSGETTSDDRGCGQVTPEIGITATPVIDPAMGAHGTIYVVAATKDQSGNYHHRLHALDLTTLVEDFSGPVEIAATYPGSKGAEKKNSTDTVQTFLPSQHEERAALLLLSGVVYTSWTSHCDAGPYTSWVIGYSETNLSQTTVLNLVPNGSEGGIWASGSGPQADAAGNVYLPIGNGTFDTQLNGSGFPVSGDYGNGYVRMSTSGGKLAVADYFTMTNTTSESNSDTDLGSGGGMLLPPLTDSQGHSRQLAVVAGKDSNIYVLDRTNLGKFNPSTDEIYQQLSGVLAGGVWSSPAWFNGELYYGASGNVLKAFAFSNGLFGTNPASQTSQSFTYPGTTPAISADGTTNGIVWVAENTSPAVLHAYEAANLATELYNSNQAANNRDHFGVGNKFIVPTVVNGKVYVGTTNGVGVFGLLSDFSLKISPASRTVAVPGSTTFTVSVTGVGGFNGAVNLTVSGLPAGATGSFQSASVTGTGSTALTIRTTTGTAPGTFTVGVTGSSGSLSQVATASLTISTASASATFVKLDTTTQGNWIGVYGSQGYQVIANMTLNPSYVTPVVTGKNEFTERSSTTDVRALQKVSNPSDRIAAFWWANSFTVDLDFTDANTHQLAIYCVDWYHTDKRQTVDILDVNGNVLNTQSLTSSFHNGVYLVWRVSGHVKMRFSRTAGAYAVVSSLFFQ